MRLNFALLALTALFALIPHLIAMTSMLIGNISCGVIAYTKSDNDRITWSLGPCLLDVSDPCTSGKISFYVYTRNSKENPVIMTIHNTSVPLGYDVSAKTKVLIHGYAGNIDFNGIVLVRKAYQETGEFNVIVVDWGELVKLPCYPVAVVNTLQAGKCTALLIRKLASLCKSNYSDFHVVGFSLGAHVAAFASNEITRLHGRGLGRITGLDPALPFFASLEQSWKLNKEDADFVDVIHTNIGIFGKIEATGHVDFYVNEGFSQPACRQSPNIPLCSHIMALVYFAESVVATDENGFWGVPCSSYFQHLIGWCENFTGNHNHALMGENCVQSLRGIYFVSTKDRPPYALGKNW